MFEKKVIEFEQPAAFYYKTAQKMLDNGNYINALPIMRKALSKEPDNYEYGLSLAEILTELTKFEESNRILFGMIEDGKDVDADCFFCLGCNFMGMNDVQKARESFEKYMLVDPEGEYREDVEDFFLFFDAEFENSEDFLEDVGENEAYKKAHMGKELLDEGSYTQAIELFESIPPVDMQPYVKNNLALAYYCLKDISKAVEITEGVLNQNKNNIHAISNMAIFLMELGKTDEAETYICKLVKAKSEQTEDIFKVAITLCELKKHEAAVRFLKELREINPYDERVLFYLAMAHYNTKRFAESVNVLMDVQKLDHPGVIAAYYIKVVKRVMEGVQEFEELGYVYQVPAEEAKNKIKYLNNCLKLAQQEFNSLWKEDDEFYFAALWGLEYGDENIKLAIAGMIAGFADRRAEKVLRDFILMKNQPDDVKNEVFILLSRMNAKEPYVAYMGGEVVEVKVDAYDEEKKDGGVEEYHQLFKFLSQVINNEYPKEVMQTSLDIVQEYIEGSSNQDMINRPTEFAAAVTYAALKKNENEKTIEKICKELNADVEIATEFIRRVEELNREK